MKPYLEYYDAVGQENVQYREALTRLKNKYGPLKEDLTNLRAADDGRKAIPMELGVVLNRYVDDLMQTPAAQRPGFSYRAVNNSPEVQNVVGMSPDVYALTKQVLEFQREYAAAIQDHSAQSSKLLEKAKSYWPQHTAAIDQAKGKLTVPDPTGSERIIATINSNLGAMQTRRLATR